MEYPDWVQLELKLESILSHLNLGDYSSYSLLPGSTSVCNYKILTTDKELVLRYFGQRKAEYEYTLLSGLPEYGVPTPEVYHFEGGNSSFLLMEYLPDGTLTDKLLNEKSNTLEIERSVMQYVTILRKIHMVRWKEMFPNSGMNIKKYPSILENQCKRDSKSFGGKNAMKDVLGWITKRKREVICTDPHLLHSDYHPSNIMLRGNQQVPIDYEGAEIGDIRYDLGFAALTFSFGSPSLSVDSIIDLYRNISGETIEDMDYFVVCSAVPRIVKLNAILTPEFPKYEMYRNFMNGMISNVEELTKQSIIY